MAEKVVKNPKKIKQPIHILILGSGLLVVLAIIFLILFRVFERITYDSISGLNRDFAIQIDSLTEIINSSIVNCGMQLFYSDAVKTMMGSGTFSNTNRVYMTRNLDTSLSSTDFAESVIIHNGYTEHVYSTDPSFPDQPIDIYKESLNHQLLISRTNEDRFKPIYCHENGPGGKEYYAFMFYGIYSDGTPKPSTLIIIIKSNWYKKSLLAFNPSPDLIVINRHGDILVSADDSLLDKYIKYYPMTTKEKNSGYFIDNKKREIYMYYESLTAGHTYMEVPPLQKTLPRLPYFHRIVVCFMVTLISIFSATLVMLPIFALIPMLRLEDAIKTIDKLLEGNEPDTPGPPNAPPPPLREQINAVVSKSGRASLEQVLYDMLAGRLSLSSPRLLKSQEGLFGFMLVYVQHRKDIYELVEKQHPEMVVTESSHIYACIGVWESEEDYKDLAAFISQSLNCRLFKGSLFTDFESLTSHFSDLNELRRLGLILNEEEPMIHEEALAIKTPANTVTTRDFTDLIVRFRSGSLDLSRAKWLEILNATKNYRHDDFQYILYWAGDTICNILNEFSSDLLKDGQKLLPGSLEQIRDLGEINRTFDRVFISICDNYSERKAEKCLELARHIREIAQEHYHDSSLNSQRIADMIQMNNAYLGRMSKSPYGRSINDYINIYRPEESMRLLRHTGQSVEEIAQRVDFSNVKYFYVLFKKFTGITPTTYRAG